MADISVATPGSTAESGTPAKALASKDRSCPYCHTNFTSSSLGRHLDLFIKEKNPKPPDGIHDIEQIRRSRGNITRRQARTSSAKREGSASSSTKPTPSHDRRSPSGARQYINGDHSNSTPTLLGLNRAGWQATGVMNDIPSATRDSRYDIRRDASRKFPNKIDMAQRKKALEERDRGRAAELALKEVLDSIQSVSARLHPRPLYAFDFFGQTFPSLCLRCLSRPSTLPASPLVPSGISWPVKPPGSVQYEVLRERIKVHIHYWMKQRRTAPGIAMNGSTDVDRKNIDIVMENEEEQSYYDHLTKAYNIWKGLSEATQRDVWHLESLQAFAREQEEHGNTHVKLQRVEEEAANLRLQVERLSNLQQPREFALYPPVQLPISMETVSVLSQNSEDIPLNFNKLVDKWKTRIQSNRSAQKEFPPPALPASAHQLNGSSSYTQPPSNGGPPLLLDAIDDDDLMDAPGDEDDDLGPPRVPTAPMDRGMLDPKLREHGPDEVMQGIEGDGDEFVGGRLLSGLREYSGVNGRGL